MAVLEVMEVELDGEVRTFSVAFFNINCLGGYEIILPRNRSVNLSIFGAKISQKYWLITSNFKHSYYFKILRLSDENFEVFSRQIRVAFPTRFQAKLSRFQLNSSIAF
jgi:hypothetical protein